MYKSFIIIKNCFTDDGFSREDYDDDIGHYDAQYGHVGQHSGQEVEHVGQNSGQPEHVGKNSGPGEQIGQLSEQIGQLSDQIGQLSGQDEFSNQPEQVTYVTGQFSTKAEHYSGDQGQVRQQDGQPGNGG